MRHLIIFAYFLFFSFSLISQDLSNSLQSHSPSSYEEAKLIIDYQKNPIKWPVLHYAIQEGREDIALKVLSLFPEMALQSTPEIPYLWENTNGNSYVEKDTGVSALELAVGQGFTTLVEKLIEKGANVNQRRLSHVESPIHQAGKAMQQIRYTKEITPLSLAIRKGYADVVTLLLQKGAQHADVYFERSWSSPGTKRQSAIQVALTSSHEELVETILKEIKTSTALEDDFERRVNLVSAYEMNELGWPSIHYAIQQGDGEALNTLLSSGIDPNTRNQSPQTAFEMALKKDDSSYHKLLLTYGYSKRQAFVEALKDNREEVALWMLDTFTSSQDPIEDTLLNAVKFEQLKVLDKILATQRYTSEQVDQAIALAMHLDKPLALAYLMNLKLSPEPIAIVAIIQVQLQ